MVAVDDPRNLADLAEAAGRAGVKPRVLVEVDIGHHRCGTGPGGAAVDLCRLAASARHLRFCGLMGYEGHIIDVEDQGKRDAGARECLQRLVDTRQAVERAGIEVPIVSSSGTGDFYVALTCAGITEVQAGSYALMDRAYGKLGLGFQHALTVLTTVTSRPAPELVITDAGMKSAPPEHGLPAVKGRDDLEVYGLSEEHGRIRCHRLPCPDQIGDRLEFIPGHGCTTVNLYDEIYAVRNGRLEAIWRIAGRGRSR
jgi:D-serine deaminase-like pyridoxal phosphate-dependent protein